VNIPAQAELGRGTLVSKWTRIGRAVPIWNALEGIQLITRRKKGNGCKLGRHF